MTLTFILKAAGLILGIIVVLALAMILIDSWLDKQDEHENFDDDRMG